MTFRGDMIALGLIALLATLWWTRPASAQPTSDSPTSTQIDDSVEKAEDVEAVPAQDDDPATDKEPESAPAVQDRTQLGGPSSVIGQLASDQEMTVGRLFEPYEDFKRRMQEQHGLSFGIDYNLLFQGATASLGEDTAASGALRFFGDWELLGRDSKDTGSLVFKVENRHRLGTDVAPSQFGAEIGYAGITGTNFSDAGWLLSNLYWKQHLLEDRLEFIAGVVDTTDYVHMYGLVNSWTDFSNLAFLNGPTIPSPSQGLGAAIGLLITDHLYVHGGIADANGDPTRPLDSFDSFFDDAELFSHLEVGWILSYDRPFSDNIHITAWHADARSEAQTPSGWGLAFSYNQLIQETWEPFLRAGYADKGGALWEWSVSTGVGYYLREHDLLAVGFNWGRPSEETFGANLDDQITVEIFYRLQLGANLAVTPDVQLLINPALNPNEDVLAVFGVRARVAF